MVNILDLFKKHDSSIALILFSLLMIGALVRGMIYSKKINESSQLCYGLIYKEASKHFVYYFDIDDVRYEGNLSSKKNYRIGDTLIIQYYPKEPSLHIVNTKKGKTPIDKVKPKRINIWDAW